jgi:hypothetical protein
MLNRAVRSVIHQTLPAAQINVAVDLQRRGAPHTRQRALDGITAPWVAFLDSDDEALDRHLRVLSDAAEETGADYVYSWYDLVRLGKHVGNTYWEKPDGTLTDGVFPPTHFTEPWNNDNPRQTTITILVRTELAKDIGFWAPSDDEEFDDGHRVGEDWVFTLECLKRGAKIHHVVERTWNWYHHGKNTSGRPNQGDAP